MRCASILIKEFFCFRADLPLYAIAPVHSRYPSGTSHVQVMAGLFYPCECCSRELNAQKLQLVKNSKLFSVKKEKRQVEKKLELILFRFRDTSNHQGVEFSPKKRRRLIHLYPCLIIIQNFHLVFLNSIKLMINLITDAWPLDVDLLQAC